MKLFEHADFEQAVRIYEARAWAKLAEWLRAQPRAGG